MDIYKKLEELKLEIPAPPPRGGIYQPVKQVGNLLYVSGQGPTVDGVPVITGKLGSERSLEEGQEAVRMCVMNALSSLEVYLGNLNKIKSVVKLLAFVASASGFNAQPQVVNGASQLLVDLWGEEQGMGARSAIGVNELPGNMSVEIELLVEI
ncbi:MAG: RidA family protein [Clostridiaceae bacterium]|nr:RidA family protein [Clostridiaceae bacterium]